MKQTVRLDLHRRTLGALNGARPEGNATADQIPVDRYLDSERTAREVALLQRRPQPVAASSELPGPGAWLARDRLGTPFLLGRQDDGTVPAFLNVCRHRGARLL